MSLSGTFMAPVTCKVHEVKYTSRNFTKTFMVKVEFSLPVLSATKIVTWKCHMDDSLSGRYDMVIGRHIFSKLVIDLKFYTNNI